MQASIEIALNCLVGGSMIGGFIYALACASGNSDAENEDKNE